jgi:hypothetical protein
MIMLPVELWKHIALQYVEGGQLSPKVYMVLSLVSRKFIMCMTILQEYYLRKIATDARIEYGLPNNKLHSPDYGKLPAVICTNDDKEWYIDGKRHRDNDSPAIIYANGDQYWYVDGKQHRDNDLPATIHVNGYQAWYLHGKYHRDNDLPAIIRANGNREWYVNGKLHRDNNLPAMMWANGSQYWFIHGVLQRDDDLPAVIHADSAISLVCSR